MNDLPMRVVSLCLVLQAFADADPIQPEPVKLSQEVTVVLDPVEPPVPSPLKVVESEPAGEVAKVEPSKPKGVEVSVTQLKGGAVSTDDAKVKLLAPFPAKPLMKAPLGWKIEPSAQAPSFVRDVKLLSGKTIAVTIRPHVLVPDIEAKDAVSVLEPGFDSAKGYQQSSTVGAILGRSTQQLENDSAALGVVLDQLQQMLLALPKTEAPVLVVPATRPKSPTPTPAKP